MDSRSVATNSTATHSTATRSTTHSSVRKNSSHNALADRIRRAAKRRGKPINDEVWLENFLQQQDRKRQSFLNKNTADQQKRLRQSRDNLSKNTGSIEKHYRLRRHLKRKDSKVGKKLTGLISRRQKCIAEIEKKLEKPQQSTMIPCINEGESAIEYKDGWIDLSQNNNKQQKGKSLLLRFKQFKQSQRSNMSKKNAYDDLPIDQISLTGSISHMSIAEPSMTQKSPSLAERNCVKTKKDMSKKKRPEMKKLKSAKSFVKRKSTEENGRLDNGAFALW